MRILIVGPAWVGDMVMAQSLFKLIKQQQPEAVLDVLAPAWSLPLLDRMPEISEKIIMPLGHGQFNLRSRYRLGKSLRAKKYDQAILLPNSFKSGLIPWFAKIPKRTGWRGEMRWGLLNDVRRLDKKRYPLMVERYLALGLAKKAALPENFPRPTLNYTSASQRDVLEKYQIPYQSGRKVLAICPGAEFGPAKRWPEEYYAEIANSKMVEGWDVWILGSPKDVPVADRIMELTRQKCVNLTGRTQLVEAIDLLSLSTVVVCNDSGLMHIAAAVDKPIVVVYGPTSPGFTPPLHPRAQVLQLALPCQPCFKRECPLVHLRCMRDIHPAEVLKAIGASV